MEKKHQNPECINTVPNGDSIACKPAVQNIFAHTIHREKQSVYGFDPKKRIIHQCFENERHNTMTKLPRKME